MCGGVHVHSLHDPKCRNLLVAYGSQHCLHTDMQLRLPDLLVWMNTCALVSYVCTDVQKGMFYVFASDLPCDPSYSLIIQTGVENDIIAVGNVHHGFWVVSFRP